MVILKGKSFTKWAKSAGLKDTQLEHAVKENKNPRGKPRGILFPSHISPARTKFARRRLKGSLH